MDTSGVDTVDLPTVGLILMVVGSIGFVVGVLLEFRSRPRPVAQPVPQAMQGTVPPKPQGVAPPPMQSPMPPAESSPPR